MEKLLKYEDSLLVETDYKLFREMTFHGIFNLLWLSIWNGWIIWYKIKFSFSCINWIIIKIIDYLNCRIAALVDSKNSYFCGGVLISKTRVLTAAHCIQPKFTKTALLPRDVRVLLGVYDSSDPFEVGRISAAVEEIKMHPNWNPITTRYDGDIAVLQMEDSITFNKFIQPICLIPPNSNMLSFGNGTVIGYGLSSKDATGSESIPKILNIPIHKNEDCFLHNPSLATISSKNTFCAGYGNGSGVCFGDSGSGLYIRHEKIQYLRGIVSASLIDSERECDVNDYAVFIQVSNYYDWITDGDDFIQPLNVRRILTKAVETTTIKTVSR